MKFSENWRVKMQLLVDQYKDSSIPTGFEIRARGIDLEDHEDGVVLLIHAEAGPASDDQSNAWIINKSEWVYTVDGFLDRNGNVRFLFRLNAFAHALRGTHKQSGAREDDHEILKKFENSRYDAHLLTSKGVFYSGGFGIRVLGKGVEIDIICRTVPSMMLKHAVDLKPERKLRQRVTQNIRNGSRYDSKLIEERYPITWS